MNKYVIYSVIWKWDGESLRVVDMTPIQSFEHIGDAWRAFPKYKEIKEEVEAADEKGYTFDDLDALGYVINDESDDIIKRYGPKGVTINRRSMDFGDVRFGVVDE